MLEDYINAVFRTFPSHFNPHSYLASADPSRSRDKVGPGLIVVLLLTPGDGNQPHFFHAFSHVIMDVFNNVSSPPKSKNLTTSC